MKSESKFWLEVKKNITGISFTRLESWASAGVPDLLCYNKNQKFFTDVINDFKFINDFNKLLKKYLDDQIYVEYIPRKKNQSNNYTVDKLIIELKPIELKKN